MASRCAAARTCRSSPAVRARSTSERARSTSHSGKERVGFARLVVKQGSEIVPFAGGEEMLDVVIDAENPLLGPLYKAVDKTLAAAATDGLGSA